MVTLKKSHVSDILRVCVINMCGLCTLLKHVIIEFEGGLYQDAGYIPEITVNVCDLHSW